MHNLFLRIKNQLSVLTTHNSSQTNSPNHNNKNLSDLPTPRTRHNSAPDMELQRSRSLKSIRVRKISKGSLKSLRRGTVCVTVSTHASSVFYDTDTEVKVSTIKQNISCCNWISLILYHHKSTIIYVYVCVLMYF